MLLVSDLVSGWSLLYLLIMHCLTQSQPIPFQPLCFLPLNCILVLPLLLLLPPLHVLQLELRRGMFKKGSNFMPQEILPL